jgi:hypothetical protein
MKGIFGWLGMGFVLLGGLFFLSSWPPLLWRGCNFLKFNPFFTIFSAPDAPIGGVQVLFGHQKRRSPLLGSALPVIAWSVLPYRPQRNWRHSAYVALVKKLLRLSHGSLSRWITQPLFYMINGRRTTFLCVWCCLLNYYFDFRIVQLDWNETSQLTQRFEKCNSQTPELLEVSKKVRLCNVHRQQHLHGSGCTVEYWTCRQLLGSRLEVEVVSFFFRGHMVMDVVENGLKRFSLHMM